MRTAVLAALLLQLLVQVKDSSGVQPQQGKKDAATQTLKYGDIIAFHREISLCNRKFKFMHFGIYIDKLRFEEYGQKKGDDLFHITGPIKEGNTIKKLSDCVFGKITNEIKTTMRVHNYLDIFAKNLKKIRLGTEDLITERILCKLHNCQRWRPLHDNCEHLATYIRYGVPISLQLGQTKEGKCHNMRHGFTKEEQAEILGYLKSIYESTENDMEEYYQCLEREEQQEQTAGPSRSG